MVRTLEYHSGLSLEEAEERYREVIDEFERVKGRYSGLFGRFFGRLFGLREEDQKALTDCLGVLIPLSLEDSVQEQIHQVKPREDTLWYRSERLVYQIVDYFANFKNTGVTRLKERFEYPCDVSIFHADTRHDWDV